MAVCEADASEALKGVVDVDSPDVRQLATDLLTRELRGYASNSNPITALAAR